MGYVVTVILFLMAALATAFFLFAKKIHKEDKGLFLLSLGWGLIILQNMFSTTAYFRSMLCQTFVMDIPKGTLYAGGITSSILEFVVVLKIFETKEMFQEKRITETIFFLLAFMAGYVASAYFLTTAPTTCL